MKKKILIALCLLVLVIVVVCLVLGKPNDSSVEKTRFTVSNYGYFDTFSTITGYAETGDEFEKITNEIFELLGEYHKLFDIYNSYEGIENIYTINELHNGEHRLVTVDQKIIDMLLYAKEMYTKTNGKMNIAMGSVLSIWHDYRTAGNENPAKAELPPMEMLAAAAEHMDINNLVIDEDNCTVFLADSQMKLDVGAFAKGYAVEMIAQYLEQKGINNFVINVGGNIRTVGKRADGKFWYAGIENPDMDSEQAYIAYLGLGGESIVTSGSYQRNYFVNGKSYHHIIDRETLMPAEYFVAVSIVCQNSADGDGLSTALFCMPLEEGQALVESLDGVEAMWTLLDGTRVKSSGFHIYEEQYQK